MTANGNGRMAATSPRDSPRTIVPERTGMPGSFGDSDEEVDKLILGVRELGVKDD